MTWIYVLAATAGVTMVIPTVLQALDGPPRAEQPASVSRQVHAFLAFALTTFGMCGIVIQQVDVSDATTAVASLTLGLAAGAVQPDILRALARRGERESLP